MTNGFDGLDWMALAAASGLTPAQAAQEARRDDLIDTGTALLRALAELRQSVRRLREQDE
jgi:hypothetical protein